MSIVAEYLSNLLCTRQRTKPEETIVYGVLFLDTALFSSRSKRRAKEEKTKYQCEVTPMHTWLRAKAREREEKSGERR